MTERIPGRLLRAAAGAAAAFCIFFSALQCAAAPSDSAPGAAARAVSAAPAGGQPAMALPENPFGAEFGAPAVSPRPAAAGAAGQAYAAKAGAVSYAALVLITLLELALALGEASMLRFIAGLFLVSACVQTGGPYLSALMPAAAVNIAVLLSAVTAVVLLPQVGRISMRTRQSSPWTDMFFLVCATPCACLAAAPFVPKFAWAAQWVSYWPAAAAAYVLPSAVLCIRGVRSAGMFTLALLALCTGAAASLYAAMTPGAPQWMRCALGPGIALAAFFLAATPSGSQTDAAANAEPAEEDEEAGDADRRGMLPDEGVRRIREAADMLVGEACRFDQIFGIYAGEEARKRASVHADAMVAAAKRIADASEGRPGALSEPEAEESPSDGVFDLRDIVQKVISDVAVHARSQGTALSWYVAPGLETLFSGGGELLAGLLPQLMLEVVRSSRGGAAGIRVEPSPEGFHPGSLRFTVTGSGSEDFGRGGALARACGLVARLGGKFAVESGPHGSFIRFDAELSREPGAGGGAEQSVPVIIAAPDGAQRPLIRQYLAGMGFELWEVRTAAEASALRRHVPAALVVMDGRLAETDMARAIADARSYESEAGLPAVPFLLLSSGEEERSYLESAGCDASVPLPPVRRDLRAMARWLMAPSGTMRRPVLTGERVTMGDMMAGEGKDGGLPGLRLKAGLTRRGASGTAAASGSGGESPEGKPSQQDGKAS